MFCLTGSVTLARFTAIYDLTDRDYVSKPECGDCGGIGVKFY